MENNSYNQQGQQYGLILVSAKTENIAEKAKKPPHRKPEEPQKNTPDNPDKENDPTRIEPGINEPRKNDPTRIDDLPPIFNNK